MCLKRPVLCQLMLLLLLGTLLLLLGTLHLLPLMVRL